MDFAQKFAGLRYTVFQGKILKESNSHALTCWLKAPFPHLKSSNFNKAVLPSGGTGFFGGRKELLRVKIDGNSARLSCHPNRFLFRHPLTVEQFASQVCVCPKIPRWKKKCAGICQCSLSGREHTTGPWKMTWSLCQWFVHFLKST